MKALISDVHGNYEALKAVFKDMDAQGVDEVFFLGDLVGYGPDPEACIDLIQERCRVTLMGNHDDALINVPIRFNPIAEEAIWCLKSRMDPGMDSEPNKLRRWKFLEKLWIMHQEEGMLFVHGSPRKPIAEYIMPSDPVINPEKIDAVFERVGGLAFCGHTHAPGIIVENSVFMSPEQIDSYYTFEGRKAIVNVGSVGQPRDGNPESCYVLLHEDRIEWRRVAYDIEATIRKVEEIGLHELNGERLRVGQ